MKVFMTVIALKRVFLTTWTQHQAMISLSQKGQLSEGLNNENLATGVSSTEGPGHSGRSRFRIIRRQVDTAVQDLGDLQTETPAGHDPAGDLLPGLLREQTGLSQGADGTMTREGQSHPHHPRKLKPRWRKCSRGNKTNQKYELWGFLNSNFILFTRKAIAIFGYKQ